MLLFSSAVYAASLTVPIKATYSEYTGWGDDPAVVDDVMSAAVTLTNPTTGATFVGKGELLLKEKSGSGTGELAFEGDPSGSIRTWAFTLLDADGVPLSTEPQVFDILFGESGNGTVVARATADIIIKGVKIRKKNQNPRAGNDDDGEYTIEVVVEDLGLGAAYVGVQELASDGTSLTTHADMEAMTADVYASYQGLALQAIVPLDTWHATVDGSVTVEGLDGSSTCDLCGGGKTLQGGADLEYDLTFYGAGTPLATVSYAGGALTLKKKNTTSKVNLKASDQVYDVYDGAMNVLIEGDARDWEVEGLLTADAGSVKPLSEGLFTLDPSDTALGGTATFTANFPAKPEQEGVRTVGVQPLGKEGEALDGWLECTLTPTSLSVTETADTMRWVGECLRDDDGRAYVRGLRMTLDSSGAGTISAELLGLAWQDATKLAFDVDGDDLGVGYVEAAASVTETSFSLDWTFADDADGSTYALELYLYGATTVPELDVVGDGMYRWAVPGGTVTELPEIPAVIWATDGAGTRSTTSSTKSGRPELK